MIISLSDINSAFKTDPAGFIASADRAYGARVREIAEDIYAHRAEKPVVLLSGPSGSGKTTTAFNIEKFLDEWGCETHTLSMDNYFLPLSPEEAELAAQGKFDLESPGRVDARFLSEQLEKMIGGEPVDLPKYDFTAAKRVASGRTLTRKPGELVILEGIHALNPEVVRIPDSASARVYVSVRTRVEAEGMLVHPSRIRLLRRMIRDRLFRSRSIAETRDMFESVELGEKRYIMPYKNRSVYDIDTFIAYEPGLYRGFLLGELQTLADDPVIAELLTLLEPAAPVPAEEILPSSLIREFIGDGCFEY